MHISQPIHFYISIPVRLPTIRFLQFRFYWGVVTNSFVCMYIIRLCYCIFSFFFVLIWNNGEIWRYDEAKLNDKQMIQRSTETVPCWMSMISEWPTSTMIVEWRAGYEQLSEWRDEPILTALSSSVLTTNMWNFMSYTLLCIVQKCPNACNGLV